MRNHCGRLDSGPIRNVSEFVGNDTCFDQVASHVPPDGHKLTCRRAGTFGQFAESLTQETAFLHQIVGEDYFWIEVHQNTNVFLF